MIEKESRLAKGGTLIFVAVVCGALLTYFKLFVENSLEDYDVQSVGFFAVMILFIVAWIVAHLLVKPSKRRARGLI